MPQRRACAAVLLLVGSGIGCNLSSSAANNTVTINSPPAQPSPAVIASPAPSALRASALIETLRHSQGRYPYELKLMDNKDLQPRIRKALGKDYAEMKADFDVQTP